MEINRYTIKELRKSFKMTQEQFAGFLKISFSTLNQWENGHRKPSNLAVQMFKSLYEKNNIDNEKNNLNENQKNGN